jgi:hypothetical protein
MRINLCRIENSFTFFSCWNEKRRPPRTAFSKFLTGCLFSRHRTVVCFFRDTRRFTTTRTQVVKFRTTNATATDHCDAVDVCGVQREHTFYAFTKRDFAHCESASNTFAAFTCNANTFVVLNTRARALGYFKTYADGVARFEIWNVYRAVCAVPRALCL